MCRGAAVVDGTVAYFIHHDYPCRVCSYSSSAQKWSELPNCPYDGSSLAVVRGLLTAIGGNRRASLQPDNKLHSIKNKKWVEHFPPMPTKRSHAAAITTEQHLIVAGGKSGFIQLDTVEMMDILTLVWSTAASLPHPYYHASVTICGDQLYMLGGLNKETKLALTCSLTNLLQSCSEASSDSVWHRITDVPVYKSTCAAVNGELVAVGGRDAENKTTAAVHIYNPTTDSWDIISNMTTARSLCLVAVLPANEIMVIGGFITVLYGSLTDKVERVYTI